MVQKKDDDDIDEEDLDEEVDEDFDEDLEDEDEVEQESDDETDVDEEDADEDVEDEVPEDEDEDEEKYIMEEAAEEDAAPVGDDRMSELAADVPVQVVAVLGKRSFNMQELMGFHVGQVVDLYRPANETVDLVVGGKLIAKGELVSIDGKLGVRIVKLV